MDSSQFWKPCTIKHEGVHPQFDKRRHLVDHLLRRADEAAVVVLIAYRSKSSL